MTSPNLATVINTPGLNGLLTIYPNGATAAQVAAIVGQAPLNAPLPGTIYFIRDGRQQNVVNPGYPGHRCEHRLQACDQQRRHVQLGAAVSSYHPVHQNIGDGLSSAC